MPFKIITKPLGFRLGNQSSSSIIILKIGLLLFSSTVLQAAESISGVFNAGGRSLPCDALIEARSSISNVLFECDAENQGLLSNSTIQEGVTVRGGRWSGYIINHGTLLDFKFVGALIEGGTVGGKIINASRVGGSLKNVHLAPGTEINGGSVAGEIQGDCDLPKNERPQLSQLTIKTGSRVTCVNLDKASVRLGKQVMINPSEKDDEQSSNENNEDSEVEEEEIEHTDDTTATEQAIQQLLASSLHGTTRGMSYFYSEEQGGVEQFTHVPYDALTCKNCHINATACTTCHQEPGDRPEDKACLVCHNRQQAEQTLSPDHHILPQEQGGLGLACVDCHTSQQIHGDGHEYNSLHENPNKVDCEQSGCHTPKDDEDKLIHQQHHKDMECIACHAQTTPVCYNCHLDENADIFGSPIPDWRFLVKRQQNGKITTGNVMPITTPLGDSFAVVAPYFAHTISKRSGVSCSDCHNSEAVEEYKAKGTITLTTWDEKTKTLKSSVKGFVPIPPDWQTSLTLEFLTKDNEDQWEALEEIHPDGGHMLFADPIDINQLPKF